MAVPYTFGSATSAIPLSQLDSNFATTITLGNTAIQLGNTVTTLNNMTLNNVSILSGNVTITNVSVTTANVTTLNATTVLATTANVTTANITTDNVTFANITGENVTTSNVTTLTLTNNPTLNGGTANGVLYLNGSKVATSGSALTFDGASNFSYGGSNASTYNTLNVNNTSATGFARILFNVGSSGANGIAAIKYAPGVFMQIGPDANDTTTPLVFAVNNGSEQMRLTSTGLGVGTSAPAGKLDIYQNSSRYVRAYPSSGLADLEVVTNNNVQPVFAVKGTGTADLIRAYSGSTQALTLDSSGNLGLGVTPSASDGTLKYVTVGNVGNSFAGFNGGLTSYVLAGAYYNSGWKYAVSSSAVARYDVGAGTHTWYTAASGTAGNAITFTQAMTLDASGNLGVGTTSPSSILHVSGSGSLEVARFETTTNNTPSIGIYSNGSIRAKLRASSAETALLTQGALPLLLGTNDTERARIDSSGNLLVGTTNSTLGASDGAIIGPIESGWTVSNSGNVPIRIYNKGSSGTRYCMEFRTASTSVGSITHDGTNTAYNTSSDPRLKTLVGAVTGSGERIDALQPVEFDWKASGKRARGFFADKFQEVYPDSVTGEKDAVDAEGNPVYQSMQASTSEVIADLVAEIQSLRKRLAAAGIA